MLCVLLFCVHRYSRTLTHSSHQFIEDDTSTVLRFPRLSRFDRRKVHIVAEAFLLESESRGTGKFKSPELHKTHLSASLAGVSVRIFV
jgi:hypothetical protein